MKIIIETLRFTPGQGILNVEVIHRYARQKLFLENPKKYPDFDFKPLKIPKLQF